MDYKNTLNLPRTDFAMKADLVAREPQRLAKWEKENLYARIQAARKDAEKFVLHDGPPFANGDVHIGTALNKILKDIIIKYQTLSGKNAPYIPGWDCHGLPIEFKVSQEMRKAGNAAADAATIRKACDAYARKYIDLQRTQFKRLGVLGDWENPYLTLNKEYEADELRLFADIVEKGFVYRGKKPVYWSIPCRTALAEAEVEYHDHTSTSVYVKFPLIPRSYETTSQEEKIGFTDEGGMRFERTGLIHQETFTVPENWNLLIWTTTPWTLPANLAVAVNSTLEYAVINVGSEFFVVAEDLVDDVAKRCGWANFAIQQKISGLHILNWLYQHPFIRRTSRVVHGDAFVEKTTGTGFVHIAPGHGTDDYLVGRVNHLPIYSPVDDDGRLCKTDDVANGVPVGQQIPEELVGKSILEKGDGKSEANEAVLAVLRSNNVLVHAEPYLHSYPFCWRSKTPVIFRAMDQWFIKMDREVKAEDFPVRWIGGPYNFRNAALSEINNVTWIPDWGVNRIKGAVQTRPDWCISRQRTWGVPIPAFYDARGEPILHADIVREVAKLIEQHGSNIWFEKSAAELWSLVKPKNWSGPEAVAKSQDTLDVWIDSGSSSRAVLMRRAELQRAPGVPPGSGASASETLAAHWQADLYLEGSDQHRGWFQSSLLLSLAGNGAAPYKTVLTHGFMVDEDREKISKSKQGTGAYLKPQTAEQYIKDYGVDVIRLWVASQDYRNDIVVSEERLKKVSETYRGIRNALRYQLSNLYDFHPSHHAVADKDLTGLDRWILNEFAKLERDVLAAYDKYEFHVVYQRISQFVAVELSSQYHDLVKDRLYTDPANSPRRRSTQTALCHLVTGLTRLLAPILAFTADEAWEFVPGVAHPSVHEEEFIKSHIVLTAEEEREWSELFALRVLVLPELEKARQSKLIGKSLEAKISLSGKPEQLASARRHADIFRELLNVSQLQFGGDATDLCAEIAKADGIKCERCWHFETDVGQDAAHPTICARCVEAVKQATPAA